MLEINGLNVYVDKEVRDLEEDTIKYVKIHGIYRFAYIHEAYFHKDLIYPDEMEKIQSGGTIGLWDNCWVISMTDAVTVNSCMVVDDIDGLTEVIGKPCYNPEEL